MDGRGNATCVNIVAVLADLAGSCNVEGSLNSVIDWGTTNAHTKPRAFYRWPSM